MPSDRKTEPPTPRRLRKARRDGDHPVSRAVIGLGALAVTLVFAPLVLEALYVSAHDALLAALRPGSTPPPASSLALRVAAGAAPAVGGPPGRAGRGARAPAARRGRARRAHPRHPPHGRRAERAAVPLGPRAPGRGRVHALEVKAERPRAADAVARAGA